MAQGNNLARSCVLALVALALSIAAACGGGTSSSPPGQPFAALALEPASVSTARGNQRSTTLTAQTGGSFDGSLALTATGAPQGVTVSFDPPSVDGSRSSNVTVSVAHGTPTGTYSITISGTGSGLDKTTTLTVTVTAEVLLTWNASTSGDVIGYNVARSDTSGSGYVRLNSELVSGTSYVDDTAQSGHTYYYVATAVNAAGLESAPSGEASAEVP
jgi:hypothetical protein